MHIKRMISMTSMSPDSCIFLYTEKCYIYFILFFIFLLSLKMKRTEICMCFEHIVDSRNLWLGFSYLSFMSIILYVQLFFFTFRFYHVFPFNFSYRCFFFFFIFLNWNIIDSQCSLVSGIHQNDSVTHIIFRFFPL